MRDGNFQKNILFYNIQVIKNILLGTKAFGKSKEQLVTTACACA